MKALKRFVHIRMGLVLHRQYPPEEVELMGPHEVDFSKHRELLQLSEEQFLGQGDPPEPGAIYEFSGTEEGRLYWIFFQMLNPQTILKSYQIKPRST